MTDRIIWLNGSFVAPEQAQVSIFDRGLLFADAVYEGLGVLDGQIIDWAYHQERLLRSLSELEMVLPYPADQMKAALEALIEKNRLSEGFLYLHATRGVQERDYLPAEDLKPNVFAFTQPNDGPADGPPICVRLASTPDLRWARRDIKTSNLLAQVMAKEAARKAGADEALMIDSEGFVTECGCSSFFMIHDQVLYARTLGQELLPGVTRRSMLEVAQAAGLAISDARYTLADVTAADECFITGASSYIQPVISVDDTQIGEGQIGPVTDQLRRGYLAAIRARMTG